MTKQEASQQIELLADEIEGCVAIADGQSGYGAGGSKLGDELEEVAGKLRLIAEQLSSK